jgi:hypothetical protein
VWSPADPNVPRIDTRMPLGTRWLLGGGSRKRALKAVREATLIPTDFFSHTEAEFALWNMLVREHDGAQAMAVAQSLAHDFPDNRALAAYVQAHEAAVPPDRDLTRP